MKVYSPSRSAPAPAIARVQRPRPYADYRLLDEHDPLVHSGAEEQQQRAAARSAAQSITAFMQAIVELKSALERGSAIFQRCKAPSSEADEFSVHTLLDKMNGCLIVFEEHADLRTSWRQSLMEPLLFPRMEQCGIVFDGHSFGYSASEARSSRPNSRLTPSLTKEPDAVQAVFGLHGAAPALRRVIGSIEQSPASALLEPETLARLYNGTGVVYSPFIRMNALKRVSLLLSRKG